ncbi:LysM peptidoglycan-binding domain-containing protein, partial [Levilactobacillus brevis]|nr:LysM peptidoglycan-binding domain-containing protein [Levilactobacillus brevis]
MKMSTGQRKTKAVVGVVGAIGAFAAGATITANADSIQVKQGDTVWDLSQKYHTTV